MVKHPIYKDARRAAVKNLKPEVKGWDMFLPIQVGRPKWSPQEVREYVRILEE